MEANGSIYSGLLTTASAVKEMENESAACQYALQCFRDSYVVYHGYISVFICIFGIIANILNIVVLTRKEMISPTNAILTGLAVSDMLVMVSFIILCIHFYLPHDAPVKDLYTYEWAVFTLFHSHFSVVFHGASIWQTVILAIWRYIAVSFPSKNIVWCSMSRAKIAIFSAYVFMPIFAIPNYLTFAVEPFQMTIRDPAKGNIFIEGYRVGFSEMGKINDKMLRKLCFWLFSVLVKLIPCILLTVLSLALIQALIETNKRRMILKNRNPDEDKSGTDRVTSMLLAVLLIFLITEFPGGITALLCGVLGDWFIKHVYNNLGEVIDILAVINSAVNFILYCTMSRLFRTTFSKLFTPRFHKWQWISMNSQNPLPIADTKTRMSVTYNTTCV